MRESIFNRGPRGAHRGVRRDSVFCIPRQTAARTGARSANRCVCRAKGSVGFRVLHSIEQPRNASIVRSRCANVSGQSPDIPKNSCVCVRMIGWKQKSAQRIGANLRAQRQRRPRDASSAKRAGGAKRTRREGLLVANAPARFSG
jgi:hypothetical protein